ncbi:hypothetical protein PHYC_01955 [Phycisphaerales bacterium]|nr:hypothetical protein PHYC_01955 [Phycisphaerales bacterium]
MTPIGLKASVALLAGLASAAVAGTTSFTYETEFSGSGYNPTGPCPWLSATITDISPGLVELQLTRTSTLNPSEFVDEWLFNVDPLIDPASIAFVRVSGPVPHDLGAATNAFNAGGVHDFDIRFDFSNNNDAERFDDSWPTSVYSLQANGLSAASFFTLSGNDNSPRRLYTAAHVQGIGDGSAWITLIPSPGTLAIAFVGLGLLFSRRR